MVKIHKTPCVLVCVTGQKDCARLIETGAALRRKRETFRYRVLNVQPASAGYETDGEELEYLRQKAQSVSAEMTVYFHDEPALITAGFAQAERCGPDRYRNGRTPTGGFIDILHSLMPSVTISMVSKERKVYHIYPESVPAGGQLCRQLLRRLHKADLKWMKNKGEKAGATERMSRFC